jgi:hypothetical protein
VSERRFVYVVSRRFEFVGLGLLTFTEAVWQAWWFWQTDRSGR